jgi:hypothetical protein
MIHVAEWKEGLAWYHSALGPGFTGIEICVADTTVQESPIAYPREVGHLKNIAEKSLGFGKSLKLRSVDSLEKLKNKAQGIFMKSGRGGTFGFSNYGF